MGYPIHIWSTSLLALAVLTTSAHALGQDWRSVVVVPQSASAFRGSAASKKTRSPILPEGRLEAGGELVFLTADPAPALTPIHFTDVGLLSLHVRGSPGSWVELSAGTSVLVKQAEAMDEPVWQGSDLTLRVPFGAAFAGTVHGVLGPLMSDQGLWWQGESSLLGRFEANDFLRFELSSGYLLTALRYSDSVAPNAWIQW